MIANAGNLHLLPEETSASEAPEYSPAPAFHRLTAADLDAAERLAEHHRELAAGLPADSELRGLALRAGGHWARLAGLPRRGLTQVDSR